MNVLLIGQDAFRAQFASHGCEGMVTPNFDRLADSGVSFVQNYCQIAPCAPSRVSTLTGCRPDTTKVYRNEDPPLGAANPGLVTLPHQFRKHGYTTCGVGQVLHHMNKDDPQGWSEPLPKRTILEHQLPENRAIVAAKLAAAGFSYGDYSRKLPGALWPPCKLGPRIECADVSDDAYTDGKTTVAAIGRLRQLRDTPFFLAVGYTATHHPWFAPKRYWDLYDDDKLEQMGSTSQPGTEKRALEHAYCACMSYLDAQLGMLLDELDRLGLTDKTVVALWADHGSGSGLIGEAPGPGRIGNAAGDAMFHVPLMIRAPGVAVRQARCEALTENVDLYPTLCELCGIPQPDGLEGTSLVPLMRDPARAWKSAVFSQMGEGDGGMRHEMRTESYRLSLRGNAEASSNQGRVEPLALHHVSDLRTDVMALPENRELLRDMTAKFRAGWRTAVGRR
jgi:iduronate 2-sulfatase